MTKGPLTKEDVNKAAINYEEELTYRPKDMYDDQKSFIAGAEWRIDSVWHDIDKDLPEYNKRIVNEDWFDFIPKDEKDLKRIISQYQFKRWAYVEDLLPNKEN